MVVRLRRRDVVAAAGGLAVAGMVSGVSRAARAAPSDPKAGVIVTPDPIAARIQPSGLAVELVEFCTPPPTQNRSPRALLNFLYHANDGSGRVFANDSRGKLWEIDGRTGATRLFIDLRQLRGTDFL